MEELNLAIANLINKAIEIWPIILLTLVGWRFKSFNIISIVASVLFSVILLGKFSFWFSLVIWLILWSFECWERSFINSNNKEDKKNE